MEGELSKDGEGEAALFGMRGSGPSGVYSTRRCRADAPEPEVFDLVRRGGQVQPFPQKVRTTRLARRIRRPRTRAGRMPQRRRKAPGSHGRRLRWSASKPTISTSHNSRSPFARDTQIVLWARLKRLRSTRVRSTAGESADPLRQSRLTRRRSILRSRLTFVMSHSEYDRLLSRGWERSEARSAVSDRVAEIMERWRRA